MITNASYSPQTFDLGGLNGISDETLEMHFKLYEGYVRQTNLLNERISELIGSGKVDKEEYPAYSELTRRLGFEYNGMVLHEHYFKNLKKGGSSGAPEKSTAFYRGAESSFGSYDQWKADFMSLGAMRGVGWAICYQDPKTEGLSNHWIDLHEAGNVSGFQPVVVMDVWEHAYLRDYAPSERPKYIEAFFANIDWDEVNRRMAPRKLASTA